MNLISFNISHSNLKKIIKKIKKKILLYDHGCKNNYLFEKTKKQKNSYIIANVYNPAQTHKSKFINEIFNKYYFNALAFLTKKLNHIHNENLSKKSWQILLNQWLFWHLRVCYSKWVYFESIEKKYKFTNFYKLNISEETIIPDNSYHSRIIQTSFYKNNFYDHFLTSKIAEFKKKKQFNIIEINKKIINRTEKTKYPIEIDKIIYKSFNNKFFFYKFQLPLSLKLKLFFIFKFINLNFKKKFFYLSDNLRKSYNRKKIFAVNNKKKDFFQFFLSTIKYSLPKIFLENFNELQKEVAKASFPKSPKYIFSSYLNHDEVFCYYCAKNLHSKKLLIGQHGFGNIFKYEKLIFDFYPVKYLSWTKKKNSKSKNFFFTKCFKKNREFLFNNKNRLIFVLYSFSEQYTEVPYGTISNYDKNKYIFETTSLMLNNLNYKIKLKADIKVQEFTKFQNIKNTLKKNHKKIKFISNKYLYTNIIDNYNLNIFIFIGTAFFESIYNNKPTILIFNKNLNYELDSQFLYFIKKFKNEKICFENINHATKFINENYFNIDKWWNKKKVQNLINKFSKIYCRHPNNLKSEINYAVKN